MRPDITLTLFLLKLIILLGPVTASGQGREDLERIAASQGVSSPLVYSTTGRDIPVIEPGGYVPDRECVPRGGLPNFFSKIENGKDVTVAFIGGSITQGEYCYRLQISAYLEELYPSVNFRWINAGVSGTGTDFGSFRLHEHVLSYDPDLVFIEFAVNGGYPDGMEGMIRQIITLDPAIDICPVYTIYTGQSATYRKGEFPPVIAKLETIAEHYNLPSIHLGIGAAQLEGEGRLLWKGTEQEAGDRILFSHDGVHPITAGGNLYAGALARGLAKIKENGGRGKVSSLPPPLISSRWDRARMYRPEEVAALDDDWTVLRTGESTNLKKFEGWFDRLWTASRPGASFSFMFEGDMFGIFDIGGPEVGQLEITVDGVPVCLRKINIAGTHLTEAVNEGGEPVLNRFNVHCEDRYRGQYDVVRLNEGIHLVTIRISDMKADKKAILGEGRQEDISRNPDKYDRSVIYLGRILLRGMPLEKPVLTVSDPRQREKWNNWIARYRSQDEVNPPGGDIILFTGSSSVHMWKSLEQDFSGRPVLNRGLSGTKTKDLFDLREQIIYPYDAKQIFIYEGDNDIGYKYPPAQILAHFRELFFAVRKAKPEATIIFISIKPSPRRERDRERISEANRLIKEFLGSQVNTGYADVFTPMLTDDGRLIQEYYDPDGLHLSDEGYRIWAKVIGRFIE